MTFSWDAFASKTLPRLAGIIAGWLVGEALKFGLPAQLAAMIDQEFIFALMLGGYAFVHRWISKRTNPGDATKSVLIREDKAIVAAPAAEGVGAAPAPAPPVAPPSDRDQP